MGTQGTVVIAILLVVPLFALGQADAHTRSNLEIDTSHQGLAADTYVLTVSSDGTFHVTGDDSVGITVTAKFDQAQQDVGILEGVVRGWTGITCQPSFADDPCLFRYRTISLKDATDVTLQPTNDLPGFQMDTDQDGIHKVQETIAWGRQVTFEHHKGGDRAVTFRMMVSVPGADKLDVDVHLHSNESLTFTEDWFYGGFLVTGEDMDPPVHADTAAGGTVSYGAKKVQVPTGQRTFAAMGPGSHGQLQIPNPLTGDECATCPETYPTFGTGNWGVDYPDGTRASAIGAGVATPGAPITVQSLIRILGSEQAGGFDFWTNEYVMGPHNDIYVIGFHGPLD